MAAYYSIINAITRPEIDEKISIGFVLFEGEQVYFDYSKIKIHAVKSLMGENAYKLLRDSIRNIEQTLQYEKKNHLISNQLTILDDITQTTFNKGYISYLSRYNNNIISFTEPKDIEVSASAKVFANLFRRFIDDNFGEITKIIRENTIEQFKTKNISRLKQHYNIDKEVSNIEIPHLIAPVKIDLLGKNKIPVYAQGLDLERNVYHIENDLGQLFFLKNAFELQNVRAKGFVVTKEPKEKVSKQHAIWQQLRELKWLEYIDVSEGEKVLSYAEEHGVKPLVQEDDMTK